MRHIPLTEDAVKYLGKQRVLTQKLNHRDTEWYSFLLFHYIAHQIKPYLTKGQRSLDIGAGLGLVNVFLRDVYDEIWLLDKTVDEEDLNAVYYGFHDDYCYYNNLEIAKELNPDFHTTEEFDFPDNHFDMIQSHMSWCWHFPKETYYDQILRALKPNGILIVDVTHNYPVEFPEFEILAELENRESDSTKYVMRLRS